MRIKRPYIGYLNDEHGNLSGWHYFESSVTPAERLYSYTIVIGPFKTKRAARWASVRPFGWGHVNDAEELAKLEAAKV